MNKTALICLVLLVVQTYGQTYDPQQSLNFFYFAKSSYCGQNQIQNWDGPAMKPHQGFTSITVFQNNTLDTQAYTGYQPDQNLIVVAFRGTHNSENWKLDLHFKRVAYAPCNKCKVHNGFYECWTSFQQEIVSSVQTLTKQYPTAQVLVTGHSLGGAIAMLGALGLQQAGITVNNLYTYGMPRIGNYRFSEYANGIYPNAIRVTHWKDPVPHVPLKVQGFNQVPTEVWYNNKSDSSDYVVCKMPGVDEDPDCSNSEKDTDIIDHLYYLGKYFSCDNLPIHSQNMEQYLETVLDFVQVELSTEEESEQEILE